MKTFSRYLLYRLKSSALRTLVLTVISVLLTHSVIRDNNTPSSYSYLNAYGEEIIEYYYESCLSILATVLGIIAVLLPILELSCFKNRRNLDTLYFLPIKREKLAVSHYVMGFIQLFTIYTVTYIFAYVYLSVITSGLALSYMLPYYFWSLLAGLVIYSVCMFVFAEANNVTDGVLFCFLWMFAPYLLLINLTRSYQLHSWGMFYYPLSVLTEFFEDRIDMHTYCEELVAQDIYGFIIWSVVGIACAVGYFFSFMRKGAEKAGEISESWFGYKTLIPICGLSLLRVFGGDGVLSIFILILMVAGYVIYRRGFKFKPSDIAMLVGGVILSVI